MKFEANNYQTRKDIERAIVKAVGKNADNNEELGHTIEGKRNDCRRLLLDDTKHIYGVKCVITDEPTNKQKLNAKSTKPLRQGKPKKHQIKR